MLRCLNNPFGYCNGKPEIVEGSEKTETSGIENKVEFKSAHCKLNPKTCGHYLRFSDVLKPVKGLGTGIRIKKVAGQETKEKNKKKGKGKGKKGNVETLQGSLL